MIESIGVIIVADHTTNYTISDVMCL